MFKKLMLSMLLCTSVKLHGNAIINSQPTIYSIGSAMSDMLMVYITCENLDKAKELGKQLLTKKLCACINIYPDVQPMFLWPPKSGLIDESKEVVVIAKTIEAKYQQLEDEIHANNPGTPCVFAIPVKHVAQKYYDWLVGELKEGN